jgi:hypothetical protein
LNYFYTPVWLPLDFYPLNSILFGNNKMIPQRRRTMRRTTRLFLELALLISLQGAGWPSNALAAKSADGFQVPVSYPSWSTVGLPTVAPIAAGKWTGYFTRDITAENSVSGVSVQATGSAKSDMTLMVDGDGNITGQLGPYHAVWEAF